MKIFKSPVSGIGDQRLNIRTKDAPRTPVTQEIATRVLGTLGQEREKRPKIVFIMSQVDT